jgi:hypothetical protein
MWEFRFSSSRGGRNKKVAGRELDGREWNELPTAYQPGANDAGRAAASG